ncbi:hypothetical protein ABL78_5472 [Leptomonas seymouri]|uniref:Uncharacterized protein n=1 Tax=Leptomonas seymouri TaxID=5684 RepID=A0A0N0P4M6_LEPSE|nr:hypothetical protein ABL78_5472 [Leptomonas seymouri]|eukprot:KPI85479.1 hypothetical protein ABL78_5472 [Leptomonas seymouri]
MFAVDDGVPPVEREAASSEVPLDKDECRASAAAAPSMSSPMRFPADVAPSVGVVFGGVSTAIGEANFTVGVMLSVRGLLLCEDAVLGRPLIGIGAEHELLAPAAVVADGVGAAGIGALSASGELPTTPTGSVRGDFTAEDVFGGTQPPTTPTLVDTFEAFDEERQGTMPILTPPPLKSPK